jgi:hypothetical protein
VWPRKCVVCGVTLRTTSARCSACRRLQGRITGAREHGVDCTAPHPDLAARLARFADRAGREEPLFDGTERG